MRTKTPEQIFGQWDRLSDILLLASWNGKEYANERYIAMFDRIQTATGRYINNIYQANGVQNHLTDTRAALCNDIWHNAATPASVYAK